MVALGENELCQQIAPPCQAANRLAACGEWLESGEREPWQVRTSLTMSQAAKSPNRAKHNRCSAGAARNGLALFARNFRVAWA